MKMDRLVRTYFGGAPQAWQRLSGNGIGRSSAGDGGCGGGACESMREA